MKSKRLILVIIAGLVVVVVAAVLATRKDTPRGGKTPVAEVLSTVSKYVQAREDRVGADQTSSSSWINAVKSVSTASWFSKLQPVSDPSTGSTSYNYTFAHQKNYVVKANLSKCAWGDVLLKPTAERGLVVCDLEDETIDKISGQSIPASSLPFGWTAVGQQTSPKLVLVNQDGHWLVDGDLTGQAQ